MRTRGNRVKPKGEFGREVTKCLISLEANNRELWKALREGGEPCSTKYIDMVIAGQRHPRVELVDAICACLGLTADRRHRMHRAAAIDAGYQIGALDG